MPNHSMAEDAFSSMPLYERPGFYSCPQTPIHCIPPPVTRSRPRRAHDSSSSLAQPMVGSQVLAPPDTPAPPSSAFPWVGEDREHSGPAFSFPDPVPELLTKARPVLVVPSRRPLPLRLSVDTSPSPSTPERVFSFTPQSWPINTASSGSVNAATTTNINGTANNPWPISRSTTASTANPVNPSPTQPTANQHNSPNDSGISLAEGDLLGAALRTREQV